MMKSSLEQENRPRNTFFDGFLVSCYFALLPYVTNARISIDKSVAMYRVTVQVSDWVMLT